MHDWVISVLFIKLDFEKAFDRVEHAYIWVILSKIGLGGRFLSLVQGLLAQATSKVHINGRFTEPIPITRGVRQGCPLSPLLFALTTQPLMSYLEAKLATGDLRGVQVMEYLKICHKLFANDMGIFISTTQDSFNKLQEILCTYEWAFGAKINLAN